MQNSLAESDSSVHGFHQGTDFCAAELLGVHAAPTDDGIRYTFRTWAPRAERVEVAGDFNDWGALPMQRITPDGIWAVTLDAALPLTGTRYKLRIVTRNGEFLKADPFARFGEWRGHFASIIPDDEAYCWGDRDWMRRRGIPLTAPDGFYPSPMHVYALHLGTWLTCENGDFLNYRAIADELIPYLRQMGYTHVALMPIAEYADEASAGYATGSYFAPTSRHGTPHDLCALVDRLHQNNIGVILDWMPAGFPDDAHGLACFDGEPLYESPHDGMTYAGRELRRFDIGRPEVRAFLISCALDLLRRFHIDGLHSCGIAAMLASAAGQNAPTALDFLRQLNAAVHAEFPDVLMIADGAQHPRLTQPIAAGGLGFHFAWNSAWADGMREYLSTDPFFRRHKHERLTRPMLYAFGEQHILPLAHDLVFPDQPSLIDGIYGSYAEKFAQLRLLLAAQMAYPGKKLLFMGHEFGQFRAWNPTRPLEWFMTDFDAHRLLWQYTAALNRFYLDTPALWEIDDSWAGFGWLEPDDCDNNVLAFRRFDRRGGELIVLLNLGPVARCGYGLRVPDGRPVYVPVFSSADCRFGGSGSLSDAPIEASVLGDDCTLTLDLPPYSALFLVPSASTVTLPYAALR